MLTLLFIATVLATSIQGQLIPLPPFSLIDSFAELAIWESLGLSQEDVLPIPDYSRLVYFRLYNRNDSSVGTDLQPYPDSLLNSSMDPNVPTKIFIFGFQNQLRTDSVLDIKNAYLERGECNFVVVDWSQLAGGNNYAAARSHTTGVANITTKFLNALADSKICLPKDQHIIGHSLGAHIAGMASGAAKIKPGRCTGLDPAGPLFEVSSTQGRINKYVATLVDIIHTAAGSWGLPSPIGHVDFYPNGGTWPQPDCVGTLDDLDGLCSHTMSFHYFAYSINHPTIYMAHRCQTHSIIRGHCPVSSDIAIMGEYVAFENPGLYYLEARVNITCPQPIQTLNTTKSFF